MKQNSGVTVVALVLVLVFTSTDSQPSLTVDISQRMETSSGVAPPAGCVVIQNARYLKNKGGFQVGHWGMTLPQILGELKKHQSGDSNAHDADASHSSSKAEQQKFVDKVYHLILEDDITRHGEAKRMVGVEQAFEHNEYARVTLAVLQKMLGVRLELHKRAAFNAQVSCAGGTLQVNASVGPKDDKWITTPGPIRTLSITDAAVEVLGCNQTSSDDILIYNMKGTRHLENHVPLAVFLQSVGYKTKTVYPNDLSPREQICEMTRERKLIIMPHGAQQSPLMFKRDGVGVIVVSPEGYLAECYRHVVNLRDPWFSVRGEVAWSCSKGRMCSESQGAWKNNASCKTQCERRANRAGHIHVSLKAIKYVLKMVGDEE